VIKKETGTVNVKPDQVKSNYVDEYVTGVPVNGPGNLPGGKGPVTAITLSSSPKIFQMPVAVPKASRAFSPYPSSTLRVNQTESPEERRGVKRKHNPTRMIEIINATKEKHQNDTGVLWLIRKHLEKNIDIQFIAINWNKFYTYYKRDQDQPHILDRTIREKFQPSKCKRDRKDPNSESEWREVDRNVTIEYNLTSPQSGHYDTVYTYVNIIS